MAGSESKARPTGEAAPRRDRCQRCGAPLTKENTSQSSGYCDPCEAQIEGEIRNRREV
ncbi:MAG: hypothetical protein IRZ11_06520 [Clostridia bacterium]|nr:hypothetical protein [Clostridia bacterium]